MTKQNHTNLIKRVPYFDVEFNGQIPTTEQLQNKVYSLSKTITRTQLIAIAFSVALLVIAYLNLWTDISPGLQAINPLIMIPAGIGLLIIIGAKLHTDRLKLLRNAFMPSGRKLLSFDPATQNYLDTVIEQGRNFLTNYETHQLFPQRDSSDQ